MDTTTTIELEREVDGRWIAAATLGTISTATYGATPERAVAAALRAIADALDGAADDAGAPK